MNSNTVISLEKVNKWYDDFHVLKDVDLKVTKGEKIVICGPSGSGKSTMIRCINRLEAHQKGKISVNGTELTNDLKNIDIIRQDVGMVFQQFNLFPHLSVLDNISLAPIWVKKTPKKEAEELAMRYLEKVRIPIINKCNQKVRDYLLRVKKFEWIDPINKNGTLVFNDDGELQTTFGNGKWNVIDH